MKYSKLTERVGGKGADAWDVHFAALKKQRAGEDVLVLSIGQETDETTPQVIIDAAIDSLERGRHHYSEISGEPDLLNALASHLSELHGIDISTANCAVFTGAQNALFSASLCTLQQGDEAIIIEPYYATYPATFSAGGAKLCRVATMPENDFMPSFDDVVKKVTQKTRAIVINSPHNPGGIIYPHSFVEQIVELCKDNGIWLISDEVYASITEPGAFKSPLSYPGALDVCIAVSSLSKSHRMTGWRLGWITAREDLIRRLFNLSLCMSYGLPMFIQDAAITAIGCSNSVSDKVRRDVTEKRELVIGLLNKINRISVCGSKTGMFVTFDIRKLGISATDFAWQLLNEYQVAVLPCIAFGESGRGILRMNIGESSQTLRTACDRIGRLASTL